MARTSISSDGPELLAPSAVESSWALPLVSGELLEADILVYLFDGEGHDGTVTSEALGFPTAL